MQLFKTSSESVSSLCIKAKGPYSITVRNLRVVRESLTVVDDEKLLGPDLKFLRIDAVYSSS